LLVVLQALLIEDSSLSDTPIAPKREAHFSRESIPLGFRQGSSIIAREIRSVKQEKDKIIPQEAAGSGPTRICSSHLFEFNEFRPVDDVLAPGGISFVSE
jgi:hypothetical protein